MENNFTGENRLSGTRVSQRTKFRINLLMFKDFFSETLTKYSDFLSKLRCLLSVKFSILTFRWGHR